MSLADTAMPPRREWQGWVAALALVAALAVPLFVAGGERSYLIGGGTMAIVGALILAGGVLASLSRSGAGVNGFLVFVGCVVALGYATAALGPVAAIAEDKTLGGLAFFSATAGFWALVVLVWSLAWLSVNRLSVVRAPRPLGATLVNVFIPAIFGVTIIFLWEVITRGLAVPFVILPPPSAIWAKLTNSISFFNADGALVSGVLWVDFQQTFLKSVLAGYVIGCLSGFLVAIAADRVPFLRRGLLPIGNLASALPIVGVAPIMVTWFGFDWPSKAAVVVAMTFFPMLINTLAGLEASDRIQRDLMQTYGANHWQTLIKLRLPVALPFIFNALKINSTLAMIGAIVAEFFGSPTSGMGFRISTEVGRMNTDMVWAEIAVAALAGSVFYGLVSLIERAVTFWHPSFRQAK